MSWLHKLLGIRVSETDKTRSSWFKKKDKKEKKERATKEKAKSSG